MPALRINMRKLKDALRLKLEGGQSHQDIATALGLSKGVVTKYVGLASAAGLDWAAIAALDEAELERCLHGARTPVLSYAPTDFGRIHQELRRKGVTLMLLWEEYCAQVSDEHDPQHPTKAWCYSQFCEHYRCFAKQLKRSMRQTHRAGEKLFIDYAGPTLALIHQGQEGGACQSLCRRHGRFRLLLCLGHAHTNRRPLVTRHRISVDVHGWRGTTHRARQPACLGHPSQSL